MTPIVWWEQTQASLLYAEEHRQFSIFSFAVADVLIVNIPTFLIPDNVLITGQFKRVRVNFSNVAIWRTVG